MTRDFESVPIWHTLPVEEVAKLLRTDLERGLTSAEIRERLQQHGPNKLEEAGGRRAFPIFISQFKSLIVLLLVVATGVAFLVGDKLEAVSILVVILLNVLIGFFTELKAEKASAALKKQAAPNAHVIREGKEIQVPAVEVVPGDIVVLT